MLEQIVLRKKQELTHRKASLSLNQILRRISTPPPPSFCQTISQPGINIISEIKYQSPSRGKFSCQLPPEQLAEAYIENGAVALSVLTEKNYFAGDIEFLRKLSDWLSKDSGQPTPILRKDFIVDPYQIPETRLYGASAYLLIVSCLTASELHDLICYGREFQLEALVEVHDPSELETAVESGARIIGVNNRNLGTFKVDIHNSFDIAKRMEKTSGYVLVSESGINEHLQILELREAGFSAFLVGSTLMDSPDPGRTLRGLIHPNG